VRRELGFEGFQEIINNKAKFNLPPEQLNHIFGCSKMTLVKDSVDFTTCKTLKFVEFLDALCRCAQLYQFEQVGGVFDAQ
jgi:hypothetical protein